MNIAAVLLVVVLAIWINSMIAEKWSSSQLPRREPRKELERGAPCVSRQARATKARLAEELSWLTCPDATKQYLVGLEALPKGRRTVRLRFQATKARYAGRSPANQSINGLDRYRVGPIYYRSIRAFLFTQILWLMCSKSPLMNS